MESHFSFTAVSLNQITCEPSGKPDRSGRVWVYDTRVAGLAFCANEGGARSFYLCRRFGGKYKRILLGRFGTGHGCIRTVEQARREAARVGAMIALLRYFECDIELRLLREFKAYRDHDDWFDRRVLDLIDQMPWEKGGDL